jgi:hypothetical protein
MLGYRLVPDDNGAAAQTTSSSDLLDDLLIMIDEFGDVVREARRAMADGHVNAADRKLINPEINEAFRAIERFRDRINGV